jgi:hypothetical protein
MGSLKFDSDDVAAYADLLVDAADVPVKESREVVQRGLWNIKRDAQRRRAGSRHFPRLASAITYDSQATRTGASGEVGPDHARPQGNLGHIPEFGALKTAPEPYMRPAAEAELPRFQKAMEALAAKPLEP